MTGAWAVVVVGMFIALLWLLWACLDMVEDWWQERRLKRYLKARAERDERTWQAFVGGHR